MSAPLKSLATFIIARLGWLVSCPPVLPIKSPVKVPLRGRPTQPVMFAYSYMTTEKSFSIVRSCRGLSRVQVILISVNRRNRAISSCYICTAHISGPPVCPGRRSRVATSKTFVLTVQVSYIGSFPRTF